MVNFEDMESIGEDLMFPAIRSKMGSRYKYTVPVQLRRLATLLPKIVPDSPFVENRKVDPKHGAEFGDYVADNYDTWIEPGILLVAKSELDFISLFSMELPKVHRDFDPPEVEIGYLKLHASEAKDELEISDGQHRTYGIQTKFAMIKKRLKPEAYAELDLDSSTENSEDFHLSHLQELMKRFSLETMNLTIISKVPVALQTKWFVTIADKSKQVKRGEQIRLDRENNSSVCTKEVINQHPLFEGFIGTKGEKPTERVLQRENTVPKGSAAIYALPNIDDVVRNIAYSFSKRQTKQQNSPALQSIITQNTIAFFDALISEVPSLQKLIEDMSYTGKEFRKESLYSSPPFIRVLADVFHKLALNESAMLIEEGKAIKAYELNSYGCETFKKLLRNLAPYTQYVEVFDNVKMKNKLQVNDEWYKTLLFRPGAKGPGSAFQELSGLSELLTYWAVKGKVFAPYTVEDLDKLAKSGI